MVRIHRVVIIRLILRNYKAACASGYQSDDLRRHHFFASGFDDLARMERVLSEALLIRIEQIHTAVARPK